MKRSLASGRWAESKVGGWREIRTLRRPREVNSLFKVSSREPIGTDWMNHQNNCWVVPVLNCGCKRSCPLFGLHANNSMSIHLEFVCLWPNRPTWRPHGTTPIGSPSLQMNGRSSFDSDKPHVEIVGPNVRWPKRFDT